MLRSEWAGRFRPRRALGRTGFVATRIGLGDLADRALPRSTCVATLRRGLAAGLNVLDTAPSYEDGLSEELVGEALAGVPREGLFVIDKVDHPDAPVAPQVAASLRRLGLARADLFVFHGVSKMELWEKLLAPGGGMDQLEACVARGLARFRGLSSHDPGVLGAAVESGRCDVLLFPVGAFADERYLSEVLPRARARGVGTVGFKAFGAGKLLGETTGYGGPPPARAPGERAPGTLSVEECLGYALTADPDVEILGLSMPAEQDAAFAAAERFRPLSPEAMGDLRRRAALAVRGKGPCWWNPPA